MPHSQITGEILTIRQLAEYLMVSEKTVYRLIDRHELPGIRVGVQWRFRKQDVDAWLSAAMRPSGEEAQRGVLDALGSAELSLRPLLIPENVWLGTAPRSRDDLLGFMISSAALDPHVDRDQLLRSVLEREAICSTALLPAAAFPHPVDPRPFRFSRKRVLLAVPAEPVDFLDPHGHRPRVIALILARSLQGHLLAFSRALKLFGDPHLIERLAPIRRSGEAIELIGEAEARLAAVPPGPEGENAR